MIAARHQVVVLALATALLGCGGSLSKNDDGSTTAPCSSLGACECMASDRCAPRTEACWCPSECSPQIACICGGGQFLACEERSVLTICSDWLTAVQSKCAGQPNVQYIGDLCTTAADPFCVSACLANLKENGSCAEIDCRFCPVCDCAPTVSSSPFASCLASCSPMPAAPL
jgi:hypothetical protein